MRNTPSLTTEKEPPCSDGSGSPVRYRDIIPYYSGTDIISGCRSDRIMGSDILGLEGRAVCVCGAACLSGSYRDGTRIAIVFARVVCAVFNVAYDSLDALCALATGAAIFSLVHFFTSHFLFWRIGASILLTAPRFLFRVR